MMANLDDIGEVIGKAEDGKEPILTVIQPIDFGYFYPKSMLSNTVMAAVVQGYNYRGHNYVTSEYEWNIPEPNVSIFLRSPFSAVRASRTEPQSNPTLQIRRNAKIENRSQSAGFDGRTR